MSNLRSDCRDIAAKLPPGDVHRAHLLCCCSQIDELEECWHAAERRAREAERRIALREWLTEMNCTVVLDADVTRSDRWIVLDVDGEIVERGVSPESAIECARSKIEGRTPA